MASGTEQAGEGRRIVRMIRQAPAAVQTALRILEGESVRLRAMALTYISLFALVPGLVVAFSVVQAFTGMERISDRVHEFLFENLAVGARATIEPYLDRFIQNAHVTSAGLVGGALLVWSSVSLFQNVDRAVNDIWAIRRRRSITQQAVIYWVGITLGPLLLAGSVMVGHTTRTFLSGTGLGLLATVAGTLLTATFFSVVYLIVPNTKVKVRAAVAGGLVAGIAWDVAKWAYTFVVARFFHYHAVYGSVAAVPIFLLWLFVSWTIVLFGARLAYVFQYASALRQGAVHARSRSGKEILGGRALLEVARAFDRGEEPPDPGDVASRLGAAADDVGEALAALKAAGLVQALGDGGLVPSRPLEKLTLWDVRRAIGGLDPVGTGPGIVAGVVKSIDDEAAERLAGVTLRELCDRDAGRTRPVAPTAPDAAGEAAGEAGARRAPSA
jgi:membrane protein